MDVETKPGLGCKMDKMKMVKLSTMSKMKMIIVKTETNRKRMI